MNIRDLMNDHTATNLRQSGGLTQTVTPTLCKGDQNYRVVWCYESSRTVQEAVIP